MGMGLGVGVCVCGRGQRIQLAERETRHCLSSPRPPECSLPSSLDEGETHPLLAEIGSDGERNRCCCHQVDPKMALLSLIGGGGEGSDICTYVAPADEEEGKRCIQFSHPP